jgi:serine/threonine protein kinase
MLKKRKRNSEAISSKSVNHTHSQKSKTNEKPISDSEAQTLLKSELIIDRNSKRSTQLKKDSIIAERYRLEGMIGEGGMGQVWKAYDIKLDRSVALKRLGMKFMSSEESYLRFIREAKVLSKLNHANICGIYDLIEDNGENYISMEYIQGLSLSEAIKKSSISKSQKIDIALGIAEGLTAAHGKGIIHRDLKPSNIMTQGAKILDFGLAKQKIEMIARHTIKTDLPSVIPGISEKGTKIYEIAINSGASDRSPAYPDSLNASDNLTSVGAFLGTIKYMSPEQARGEEIDFRSDIFSFGIILYELFSGSNPFTGQAAELLYNIQVQHPKPLYKMHTGCPLKLARMIDKAMEKDKDKRPNAQMFVQLLNAYKNRLFKKPHQVAAVGLIGAALIALSILQFTSGGKAKEVYTLALMKSTNQTGDQSLNWISTGLTDTIRTTLQESIRINPVTTEKIYSLEKQMGIGQGRNLRQDEIVKASDFLGKAYICTSSLAKKGACN